MSDAEATMPEPTSDPTALVEITSEVVSAYLARNHVQAAEIPALIASVHATLADLGKAPEPEAPKLVPPVPVKKSIGDDFIVSMEDGKRYKSLKRHLSKRGLTPAEYRAKWGLPADYPMVSPAYSRQRSALAKESNLGAQRRKR